MTEEDQTNEQPTDRDYRAITVRLKDLQRKCRSAGSRNDEAMEVDQRIEAVLNRLNLEQEPGDEPPPFAALARELYSVERFFESNGFISVAKEVAHVERALEALTTPDEAEAAAVRPDPVVESPESYNGTAETGNDLDAESATSRWAVPKPLAAVMLLFVAAIAVCAIIIFRHQKVENESATTAIVPPTQIPIRVPPTPAPTARVQGSSHPAPGAVLAEAVGNARLSLAEGDVDATIDHLSKAALIDSDHHTVLGTARQLVDLLVERANAAADGGLWEIAELTLARADRLATRYGLDTSNIGEARLRHSRMDRFRIIKPTDTTAIRAAAGLRVTVVLRNGSNQESVINGAEHGNLLLNEDTTVRGGAMYYVEKIPLSEIDYLKVWEE